MTLYPISIVFAFPQTPPAVPFAVFGVVSVNGLLPTGDLSAFRVRAARPADDASSVLAADEDGLGRPLSNYSLKIPVNHREWDPDGAVAGEELVLRVFWGDVELRVVSPENGRMTMGESGGSLRIDLDVSFTDLENRAGTGGFLMTDRSSLVQLGPAWF